MSEVKKVDVIVLFEAPFWCVLRDGKRVATLGRADLAKLRARQIAKLLARTGVHVVLTIHIKKQSLVERKEVRQRSARARRVEHFWRVKQASRRYWPNHARSACLRMPETDTELVREIGAVIQSSPDREIT
jgi:hypothetical protein